MKYIDPRFHYNNKLGLDKAYASKSGTHVEDGVMYIAGTRNVRDWYDDFTKLPFGLTKHAQRYKDAEQVLKDNPQVTQLVGHSLASSVSDELRKQHPGKKLELKALYGSPFIDWGSKQHENRFRHKFDPVSILDRGAQTVDIGVVNPLKAHDYDKYPNGYYNKVTAGLKRPAPELDM